MSLALLIRRPMNNEYGRHILVNKNKHFSAQFFGLFTVDLGWVSLVIMLKNAGNIQFLQSKFQVSTIAHSIGTSIEVCLKKGHSKRDLLYSFTRMRLLCQKSRESPRM